MNEIGAAMALFRNKSKIASSENALRNSLWPHAESKMWHRKEYGGFVTVPKTMPFICRMLDESSKNHPLGSTYQALWAFTWDNNAFIRLNRAKEVAYAAGFTGQRGERTLLDRIKRLSDAGFVEVKPSGGNRFGFIFIPNPHEVVMRIWALQMRATADERPPITLQEASYNAFLERALEIGCNDVKEFVDRQRQASESNAPVRRRSRQANEADVDEEDEDTRPRRRARQDESKLDAGVPVRQRARRANEADVDEEDENHPPRRRRRL
jgi:hypothetical protein